MLVVYNHLVCVAAVKNLPKQTVCMYMYMYT